jgi:hypothetical protein
VTLRAHTTAKLDEFVRVRSWRGTMNSPADRGRIASCKFGSLAARWHPRSPGLGCADGRPVLAGQALTAICTHDELSRHAVRKIEAIDGG